MATREAVDVLILTAIKPEYDAVLDVSDGALTGSKWVKEPGPTGLEVAFRDFQGRGGPLRVAVTRIPDMGEVWAASAGAPLIYHYKPQVLAMCGVCAGRPDWVQLGDVIVADTLWKYDAGESVSRGAGRKKHTVFRASTETYKLHSVWKERAESLSVGGATWLSERPLAIEVQLEWLLAILLNDADPAKHPERAARCPNFEATVKRARKRRWVAPTTLKLTKTGTAEAKRLASLHPDGPAAPGEFRIHVAPMASGAQVIQDGEMWDRLAERVRKVCGLEMEAAAVGAMQWFHGVDKAIVMKAVMDFANEDKDDHFKPFAARASAECLIKFLRENLAVIQPETKQDDPGSHGATDPDAPERQRAARLALMARRIADLLKEHSAVRTSILSEMNVPSSRETPEEVAAALLRLPAERMAQVLNYADSSLSEHGTQVERMALRKILCLAVPIAVDWEELGEAMKSVSVGTRNWIELPFQTMTAVEAIMAGIDGRGCQFIPVATGAPHGAALVHIPSAARTAFFQSRQRFEEMVFEDLAQKLGAPQGNPKQRREWVVDLLEYRAKKAAPSDRFSYYVVFDKDLASEQAWQIARSDDPGAGTGLRLVRVGDTAAREPAAFSQHIADIYKR